MSEDYLKCQLKTRSRM